MKRLFRNKNMISIVLLVVGVILSLAIWTIKLKIAKTIFNTTYEYYDLNNNYGTSLNCKLTENGAMCLIDGTMVLVSQFSER